MSNKISGTREYIPEFLYSLYVAAINKLGETGWNKFLFESFTGKSNELIKASISLWFLAHSSKGYCGSFRGTADFRDV